MIFRTLELRKKLTVNIITSPILRNTTEYYAILHNTTQYYAIAKRVNA